MSVLVTGGAGYIGSHIAAELVNNGEDVIIVDNLSQGNRRAILGSAFYKVDICDYDSLLQIFRKHDIEAVVHCAARSLVGESVANPIEYYNNNVYGTERLLSVMVKFGVQNIVYSSSAAVYGEPETSPIKEDARLSPKSPYGETKMAMERMFHWVGQAYNIKTIGFRYFNAAGAHTTLDIGEYREVETHLIPLLINSVLGLRAPVHIFGSDYQTPDGTCIRDYVHVMDIANAHWLALNYLRNGGTSDILNLGSGKGYSVREVIQVLEMVAGCRIPVIDSERRPGDPAILIASSEKASRLLGWEENNDLEVILSSALKWHSVNPYGFRT